MVEKAEHSPEQVAEIPVSESDQEYDTAGPPIVDQTEIKKLQQEATTDQGELPPFDVAAMAYKLGMTPQELKSYIPSEKAKQVRKLTKEEVLQMHEAAQKKQDQKKVAKLAKSIEGAKRAKTKKMERVFAPVADEKIEQARSAMEAKPEIAEAYGEMIEAHNQEALRAKSQQQLDQLTKTYYGASSFWEQTLPWKKKQREQILADKESKLAVFKKFVSELKPVNKEAVAEKPDTQAEDALVKDDDYVTGGFVGPDQVAFGVDRFHTAGKDELDKSALEQSGQIVTNNIHFVANRVPAEKIAETYLNNTFDYQTGKDILAVYLASVFKNPEEANNFLNDNYNKNDTEWNFRLRPKMGEYSAAQAQRREEILQAAEKIYGQIGMLPPTNMEVRLDRAAVKEEAIPEALAA